jgi:hypothetical protein
MADSGRGKERKELIDNFPFAITYLLIISADTLDDVFKKEKKASNAF